MRFSCKRCFISMGVFVGKLQNAAFEVNATMDAVTNASQKCVFCVFHVPQKLRWKSWKFPNLKREVLRDLNPSLNRM